MRVISRKTLKAFAAAHPRSVAPLNAWWRLMEKGRYGSFDDFKRAMNTTDKVGDYYVFNIGGNKYRVVASVAFGPQQLYVKHVFTHGEYDAWKPK